MNRTCGRPLAPGAVIASGWLQRVGLVLHLGAPEMTTPADPADAMRQWLALRRRVGVATGILMERGQLSSEEARALLTERAAASGVPLEALVDEIITGRVPE
jgi:ANTAR domain